MFRKILIANRGEIAVRIIRCLREMGISSVAVFSDVDRTALHVQMADEAVHIGPAASTESYLCIEKIIAAAAATGAEAIHPGYGFLSENAAFAQACADSGVKFIGPSPDAIDRLGSKTAARRIAISVDAPIVPGTQEGIRSLEEAVEIANRIGFPVLLKAAAGGGGKGIRRVDRESDLRSALRAASSEAERAFGSEEVYLEKLIENPRHIEVQVLGDERGHLIHFGERECSIQRRHQKVIEEAPSPLVAAKPGLREEIGDAAVRIARAVNYANAGTVEFIADQQGSFYFLEMNTRLQVEHPVTEWVTGSDLVRWQILIAAGMPLTIDQRDLAWRGSAIECRVYAEDPENNFFPSYGSVARYSEPSGPGVRVDSGVFENWGIPLEYDPLLAKLTVWADSRVAAIERMRRALSEYCVMGVQTNLALLQEVFRDEQFIGGQLSTNFLEEFMGRRPRTEGDPVRLVAAAIAAAQSESHLSQIPETNSDQIATARAWRAAGMRELIR